MANKFYVYALGKPTGEIFYIGKGTGPRIRAHEQDARRGTKGLKCDIIRDVWAAGQQITRTILFETEDERAAYNEEVRQISLLGKKALTNVYAGGGGLIVRLTRDEDIAELLCKCRFCNQQSAEYLADQREF
jgi:hypothetical protein